MSSVIPEKAACLISILETNKNVPGLDSEAEIVASSSEYPIVSDNFISYRMLGHL